MESEKKNVTARVIEVQKELYKVCYETKEGNQEKNARLKGSVFYRKEKISYPAVGDYVRIRCNEQGDDVIEEVLPRTSWFSRPDPATGGMTEQGIAANFDYILLLQSLNQNFNPRRMERYLAAAWDSGAVPVIVLTKTDLLGMEEEKSCQPENRTASLQKYISQMEQAAPGVQIFAVSALTGEGMEELEALAVPGKTLLLTGSSGIGKSTLINALAGETVMETSAIREEDGRGRHTTTHRQLITLKNGAFLIDTPGMRELGIWNVEEGVTGTFADVEELARNCRFRDCRHDKEAGCAVKEALADGRLTAERFHSWQKLQREAAHAARRQQRKQHAAAHRH